MTRALYILFLVAFWILLSGHFNPLMVFFGAASCALVWWISHRMDIFDHAEHPVHVHPVKFVGYCFWLGKEVIRWNLDVSWRILHPALPIHPRLIKVRTSQRTELGQVIYANSITLTPGTVSIDLQSYEIEVHALTPEAADDLLTGDMDRRISAVEQPQPDDPRAGGR